MVNDAELLRRYAQNKDENAFAELVARHFNLVYSAALRLVGGDPQDAQDVAQTVFADFARKTDSLALEVARGKPLAGWLYTSTRFAASRFRRGEQRRQTREQAAQAMNDTLDNAHASPDPAWSDLRPLLDDAMGELNSVDRDALLLRYFEGQDFRQVAAALGFSEDAARKRISRAMDRLRSLLAARGVTTSTAALGVALAAYSVQAAPLGLAAAVSQSCLASALAASAAAAATTSSTLPLIQAMASTKLKVLLVSLGCAGVVAPLTLQHRAIEKLRAENQALHRQIEIQSSAVTENAPIPSVLANRPTGNTSNNAAELARLRGEVIRLRGLVSGLRSTVQSGDALEAMRRRLGGTELQIETQPGAPFAPHHYYPSELWTDVGLESPEAVLQTSLWAIKTGNTARFLETQNLPPEQRSEFQSRWTSQTLKDFPSAGALGVKVETFGGTLATPSIDYIVSIDRGEDQPTIRAHFYLEKVDGVWRMKPAVAMEGGQNDYLLPR